MRKCVQNLPSGKEIKTDANNKIKNHTRRQEMNRHPKNKTNETKTRSRRVILLLLLLSTLFWAAGCEDYYSSSPGYYGPGLYDAGSVDFLGHDEFIIAALDTGTAARIMSGRQVTGHFAPVSPPPGAPVSPAPTAR